MSDYEEDLEEIEIKATMVSCTIKLTREQGFTIKSLIQDLYPHTFPHYCQKVGISTPNFYSTLNGERPCSLEFINKLLSGIGYQATVSNPEILIQEIEIGEIVNGADCITQEIESLLNDSEEQDTPESYL